MAKKKVTRRKARPKSKATPGFDRSLVAGTVGDKMYFHSVGLDNEEALSLSLCAAQYFNALIEGKIPVGFKGGKLVLEPVNPSLHE